MQKKNKAINWRKFLIDMEKKIELEEDRDTEV